MIKYYYLIPEVDLVYDMVKFSIISLDINDNPTKNDVIKRRSRMRCITDVKDFNKNYIIVKMGVDFSTPFKGIVPLTQQEINKLLKLKKWKHNRKPFITKENMMKFLMMIFLMLIFSVCAFAGDPATKFDWITLLLSYDFIAEKLVIAFAAFLAIASIIPGDQPDKFLQGVVDFLKKFSRK